MTEIEDLKDKIMLVKDAVDNNNQETTKSPTNDFIFYYFVLTNETSTSLTHFVESVYILTSLMSVVQTFDFNLFALSQLMNFPTKDSVGKNLIEL